VPGRRTAFVVVPVAVAAIFIAVALDMGFGHGPVGLAEYLGWRDAQTPELAAREARVVQHRIDACMAALGLPYREFVEPPPGIPDADLGPRDWAAKWGFGVSTSVGVVSARRQAARLRLHRSSRPAREASAPPLRFDGRPGAPGELVCSATTGSPCSLEPASSRTGSRRRPDRRGRRQWMACI
jgi:hypothetical protein